MVDENSNDEAKGTPPGNGSGGGSVIRYAVALVGLAISGAFLANLGFGVWGEIPDNIPGIGNLDEAFFTGLFLYCLGLLGIDLLPSRSKRIGKD